MEQQLTCRFFSDFIEKNNVLKVFPSTFTTNISSFELFLYGDPDENTAIVSFENFKVTIYAKRSRKKVTSIILIHSDDEIKHTIVKNRVKQFETISELNEFPTLKEFILSSYEKM